MSDSCLGVLKEQPRLQVSGFSLNEMAAAICRAVVYDKRHPSDLHKAVKAVRTSKWPQLSKAVSGGLQHVVSVDNAANYAELWQKGGSWYAVTGAETGEPKISKSGGLTPGIYEIPKVYKGMPIDGASARFLGEVFGMASIQKSGDCGCK